MSRPERAHGSLGFGGFAARGADDVASRATTQATNTVVADHQRIGLDFAEGDAFPSVSALAIEARAQPGLRRERVDLLGDGEVLDREAERIHDDDLVGV